MHAMPYRIDTRRGDHGPDRGSARRLARRDGTGRLRISRRGALFPRAIAHRYLDRGADGAAARPLRYDETRLAVRFGRLHALSGAERARPFSRSEEHTSELQSLMRISYAVFCLKKKKTTTTHKH